jgi:DNA-binding beta-propeller fold protein YncE
VAGGKVFVADTYNDRVQVFDASGAYLTTLGGSEGSRTGELSYPEAVDVDAAGNVYVADSDNSRIQEFAPGVPGRRS